MIRNNGTGKTINAQIDLVSECWNADLADFDEHDITYYYPGSSVSSNLSWDNQIGWNICWRTPVNSFGLGKYKVTVYTGTKYTDYFYIDYRTSDLPEAYTPSDDIHVFLNANNGILYWDQYLTDQLGTDYTLWGLSTIKGTFITLKTTELEPFPPADFQLSSGTSISLAWNPDPLYGEYYWTNYAVYRSVVTGCGSPSGNFTKIATLSASTENYTDYNFSGGGWLMTAYYKIAAVNGNRESIFTDPLSICVFPGLDKKSNGETNYEYRLSQNFPNPFNPLTSIKFSLKENSFISLKIYDILGREVAILLEGIRSAGEHSVEFNAQNLESGIYFYEIKTENFRDIKKLILIK